jgi:hypothetical protein
MREECRLVTIACGRGCRVDWCEHGTVHLSVGDVTLRLSPAALGTLASTLLGAQRELAVRTVPADTRPC